MLSDLLSGFIKVISAAGAAIAVLLILAILGAVNQHDKLLSMAAVGDGIGDVFHYLGELLSELFAYLK